MCNDIDHKIAVMQAFKEGKKIEFTDRRYCYGTVWCVTNSPTWDWLTYNYRIKEEPKYDWIVEACECDSKVWGPCRVLYNKTETEAKESAQTTRAAYSSPYCKERIIRYRRIASAS